jgi:cytochrome b6-f complex iron-sulfur subunit
MVIFPISETLKKSEGKTAMERRSFVQRVCTGLIYGIGAAVLVYPAFAFMTFRRKKTHTIVFPAEEQHSPVHFKNEIFLVNSGNSNYALSARCTHLGCIISFDPLSERFLCPCHGSVFDLGGKKISGPAKTDLLRMPIRRGENSDIIATVKF